MQFENIIGHERIKKDLENMLENEKISHAILFSGPEGVGKASLAKVFSKTILCEGADKPCGICNSCIQFENKTNPDFLYIEPENGIIKKEEITKVLDFFSIKPFSSKCKVAVIKGFDKSTVESQNAFLKTLEDPPEFAKIILTAEKESALLPTILSRVKKYYFSPLTKKKVEKFLIANNYEKADDAKFIANYSNGSIKKAIKLSTDEEYKNNRIFLLEILEKAMWKDKEFVLRNMNFFEKQENLDEVIELYLAKIRDLLVERNLDANLESKSKISTEYILRVKELLMELKIAVDSNVNKMFAIELFFIEIMEE